MIGEYYIYINTIYNIIFLVLILCLMKLAFCLFLFCVIYWNIVIVLYTIISLYIFIHVFSLYIFKSKSCFYLCLYMLIFMLMIHVVDESINIFFSSKGVDLRPSFSESFMNLLLVEYIINLYILIIFIFVKISKFNN